MVEWWNLLSNVEKMFVGIAFPFSLLTVVLFVLELIGVSGDSDGQGSHDTGMGLDHGSDGFIDHFSFFSVRNFIYFLMMFGWTGLACSKMHFPTVISILVAVISGMLTTFIIGWIFYMLGKLTETGNVNIDEAVGKIGSVYIPIPEKRSGFGVVQTVIQGMTQELNAVTDGDKLSTGKSIQIVEILGPNTALVVESNDFV